MTLLEPRDLLGFVRRDKTVILLLGPCGSCGRPKGDVLAAILSQKNLITHLVADSRSVRQLLDGKEKPQDREVTRRDETRAAMPD
jgi:hypothetical protein